MKCMNIKSGVTYVFTKDELENFKMLIKTIVYTNTNLKIELKLTESDNKIIIHDNGHDNDVITASWIAREGKDDYLVTFDFADTVIDEKLQIPTTDDWYSLFSSAIIGRLTAINEAEASVDKSTVLDPKAVPPMFSVDLLGKSYFIYQKFQEITDPKGKPRKVPAGVYAKLASSVNITDERMIEQIKPVQRMNDSWVCYGDAPKQKSHEHGHASRILKNKDMLEEYGIKPGDNAAVWDLIEQRRIVPIYVMDVTIDACAARSVQFIENVLAENKYNPKFTKSNLIL